MQRNPFKNLFKKRGYAPINNDIKTASHIRLPPPLPIYEEPVPYRTPVAGCAANDYKCKFESCENRRKRERPLPAIPPISPIPPIPPIPKGTMRKSSGEYENDNEAEGDYDNVEGAEGRRMLNLNNAPGETTTGGGKKRRSTTRRRRRNSKSNSKSRSRSTRKKRGKKTRKHGKYINKKDNWWWKSFK